MNNPQHLIDMSSLMARLGIGGTATVYRRIKDDPRFPKPVKLGRLTRFVDAEVSRYIEELADAREPSTLVHSEAA